MKQLIVLTAILPIILLFMMQFSLDQKNNSAINSLQQHVYAAKEEAKQEGCFTVEIIENLKKSISEKWGIPEKEIIVIATETPQYRINYFDGREGRGMIHYSVRIPIEKIMAGSKLLGISEAENRGVFVVEGTTASERLPI
jgi:hypothetical protein